MNKEYLKSKIEKNMQEAKEGRLKSSTGQKVTDRKQILAIAYSQARKKAHEAKKSS